jgi:transcription elongation factor GreA
VVERLSLARGQGDLSENAEYSSARDELAFIDGRIEEIEEILKNSVLVEEQKGPRNQVCLGCRVTVGNGKDEHIYHIVGEWEADPTEKKVSHSSPLGQALLGRKVGEEVEFEAPAGKTIFRILKIE